MERALCDNATVPTRMNSAEAEAIKLGLSDVTGEHASPDEQHLSLFEKKALLVNQELDTQGMGRYQWMIFFLCGFGYLLDLLWAQAFGLVVTPMQNEFGFDDTQMGYIFTSFSIGLTAGAFIWGILVDIIGRKPAFNYTVLISTVFGACLGLPNNYITVVVLTGLTGLSSTIQLMRTYDLLRNRNWYWWKHPDRHYDLFRVPTTKSAMAAPVLSVFQPIGVIICTGLAFTFIPTYSCAEGLVSCKLPNAATPCYGKADNWGWRYMMFTIGGITSLVFVLRFALFRFQESPKFLLTQDQDDKAIEVLQYIATFNGQKCGLTLEDLTAVKADVQKGISPLPNNNDPGSLPLLGSEKPQSQQDSVVQRLKGGLSRFQVLFSSPSMTRLVLLVWLIYAFDFWGFTIAGSFLPTILARKGKALGLSLADTYRSYIYIYSLGIPGVLTGTLIYSKRRLALVASSVLFGACLFVFTIVHDQKSYIAVNALVYFFQSMFNAILYGWTPEAFPATVRGSASGMANFWGRVAGIVAPIVATRVLAKSLDGVLYLAGSSIWICTIAVLLLPTKFLGKQSY